MKKNWNRNSRRVLFAVLAAIGCAVAGLEWGTQSIAKERLLLARQELAENFFKKSLKSAHLQKVDETILMELNRRIKINSLGTSADEKLNVLVILKTAETVGVRFAKMHKTLAQLPQSFRVQMVVDSLVQDADSTQGNLIKYFQDKNIQHRAYYILNAIYAENIGAEDLAWIAAQSEVKTIINNTPVRGALSLNFDPTGTIRPEVRESFFDGYSLESWLRTAEEPSTVGPNIAFVGANQVWEKYGNRGEGIVVAGQDTGVDWDHPALINQYRGKTDAGVDHRFSWHDSIRANLQAGTNPCGLNSAEPCDDNKHGTHTMGTVVGDDRGANQIGVAPRAKWIACRNMERGLGTPQTYLECYEFFLAPYPQGGNPRTDGDPALAPNVINNSWGCPMSEGCQGKELIPVLQAIKAAGIMNVVSAGNEGPNCGTVSDQPATITNYSFTVGAISDANGNIANFSSRGPSAEDGGLAPLISAPGVNVKSSIPGGGYSGFMWSGTSMAGPHVAGAVALLWKARPDLMGKIDASIQKITAAATPKTSTQNCGTIPGTQVPNHTYGYGNLNILKAIETP